MKSQWSFVLLFILLCVVATAQVDSLTIRPDGQELRVNGQDSMELSTAPVDSTRLDSMPLVPPLKERIFGEYPNPRTALVLSLILPGAGQAYNKKYWKVPIVYGALGYLVWRISENRTTYQQRRDAHIAAVTGDSTLVVAPELQGLPANSLRILRDNSKKQLESNWIFLVLTYALNGIDAYVDAHLLEFDVSEDLSLKIDPALINNQTVGSAPSNRLGLRVSMSF